MSGISRTSDGLDPRRKRILFRSWHRGTKEMDLLLGSFVEARIADFSDAELDRLEHLMDAGDTDLLDWITGRTPVPAEFDGDIFRALAGAHGAQPAN